MTKSLQLATMAGLILIAASNGIGASQIPEKINLTQAYALAMAIGKNADLQVEAFAPKLSAAELARSGGIYDPLLTASANVGGYTYPDQASMTRKGGGSVGISQALPTGGTITAFTSADYYRDPTVARTSDWITAVGLTITQPLLKNRGREATEVTITLAANSLEEARERFRFVTIDTVLATITAYNRLYALRETLDSRTAAYKGAQNLLDELRKKRRGSSSALQKMEIANAEYSVSQRQKEMVDADRNVRDQEATVRYQIGMSERTQIVPVDPPSLAEPPDSEIRSVEKALQKRADLRQLRIALKSTQLQERVASNQTLPDLSLNASGAFDGTGHSIGRGYQQLGNGKGTSWSAGLHFSLPLGNTTASNDLRKSRIKIEQAEQQIATLAWKVRNDVEADQRALISARLQLQTAKRSLEFAEQRREEYLKNNKAGTATIQEVINAENDYAAARIANAEARETFANAVAKLWRDTGELLEAQGVQIKTAAPA